MASLENFKQRLLRIRNFLFFGLAVVAIVIMFPREGKFRYEFQKGKPWMHETLVAPFDFPIYKTDATIQVEKDSLMRDFQPYFRLDTGVETRQVRKFSEVVFPAKWDGYMLEMGMDDKKWVPGSILKADSLKKLDQEQIMLILNSIYRRGIADDFSQLENATNNEQLISVVRNQVVQVKPLSTVFTQKAAYEQLIRELKSLGEKTQPGIREEKRFVNRIDAIDYIEPNLFYDQETSRKVLESMNAEISLTQGMVQSGEKIIGIGEPVTEEKYQVLQSLKKEYETNPGVLRNYNIILAGKLLLVLLALYVLYLFLYHFRREVLESGRKTFFIIMMVVVMAFIASLTLKSGNLTLYVIPFVILPIMIKTFYDERIALFVHLVTILLIGFWAPNGFEFVFMNFIAGTVTIFTLRNVYRRGVLFIAAVFAFFSYSLVYTGVSILQEGRLENVDYLNYAWFAGNALLVLTSYPLIYIFERLFGFISDGTLLELSDTNQPLLRKLAETAPGTFQHSMQVANLGEEAALAVGANSLLIRAGALYHDIGKMEEPMYFIENLTSSFNPHDHLEFEQSAEKIIGHVSKGVEIAKKYKLPDMIVDFIRTHHGTSTVQYFYKSYLKQYPEAEVDIAKFSYPGPKPFSKETAILMMADSVEAASRSLKTVTKEIIRELVENIIETQFKENQFENVDLTMRDFNKIRELFRKRLINIYHARVEYPK